MREQQVGVVRAGLRARIEMWEGRREDHPQPLQAGSRKHMVTVRSATNTARNKADKTATVQRSPQQKLAINGKINPQCKDSTSHYIKEQRKNITSQCIKEQSKDRAYQCIDEQCKDSASQCIEEQSKDTTNNYIEEQCKDVSSQYIEDPVHYQYIEEQCKDSASQCIEEQSKDTTSNYIEEQFVKECNKDGLSYKDSITGSITPYNKHYGSELEPDTPTAWEYQTLKLELELRDERVAALTKQLDELSLAGQGDQELTKLRKTKHDLESKIKDQEEELDELAGQVQMLEAARTRLEMSTEQLRKESKRELQQREEEVEEVRLAAQKRVKALEAQVEAEHEERTQLVRDKHELERRLVGLMDRSSAAPDDDAVHRLKKDLRKTKALLKDTQTMLEKSQSEGPSKLIIRQLKTQLEDCEFAKTAALKARLSADADLSELQSALDDAQRARKEVEDRSSRLLKEKTELQTQLEEGEELHAETLKKYKCTVSQVSVDQITLAEQSQRIAELEQEKQILSDRLLELSSKVEVLEGETANIHTQRMLQMKVKELESKLELELSTRKRIESQVVRLKEQMERLSGDCDLAKLKETQSIDQTRKLDRQLRQTKEEAAMLQQRNTELTSKRQELEKQMELMDSEIATLKSDLKLAFKRIEDLQMALQGDISDSDSDLSDSGSDSDASLTGFLPSVRASRSAAASSNASPQPNRTAASPSARGEDLMSPGSDAMAIIEEAKEENQHSESFA